MPFEARVVCALGHVFLSHAARTQEVDSMASAPRLELRVGACSGAMSAALSFFFAGVCAA